jgi:hypothetical protein
MLVLSFGLRCHQSQTQYLESDVTQATRLSSKSDCTLISPDIYTNQSRTQFETKKKVDVGCTVGGRSAWGYPLSTPPVLLNTCNAKLYISMMDSIF